MRPRMLRLIEVGDICGDNAGRNSAGGDERVNVRGNQFLDVGCDDGVEDGGDGVGARVVCEGGDGLLEGAAEAGEEDGACADGFGVRAAVRG